ncbi:MAG: CRISPR-associated endonuclease Cas3'' [Desulfurococcales archaeon]|nr:CRISPR-associated endonuclease Cas3'' [Desulfurococcales archaeon]
MSSSIIAWCSPGEQPGTYETYTLIQHSLHTAAIADLFYDRWRWRSKVSNLPDSLLLITAGLHDIGKAWRGYQEAALSRCSRGREPSFRLHELLSGIVAASMKRETEMERETERHRRLLARSPLWEALIVGVILHHHGMTSRYENSIVKIIDKIFRDGIVGKGFPPLSIRELLEDALPPTREILKKLGCLAEKLGKGYNSDLMNNMIKLVDSLAGRIASNARLDQDLILKNIKDSIEKVGRYPEKEELSATITVLAGFTAVADTTAASIERSHGNTIPRGTYAWRVLGEAFGEKAPKLVQDRLDKARQCL